MFGVMVSPRRFRSFLGIILSFDATSVVRFCYSIVFVRSAKPRNAIVLSPGESGKCFVYNTFNQRPEVGLSTVEKRIDFRAFSITDTPCPVLEYLLWADRSSI